MKEVNKTVQLHLEEPYNWKKKKIVGAMRQVRKLARLTSERLPSLSVQQIENPRGKGSVVGRWVREFREIDDITLNFNCAQKAVERAFMNYDNIIEEKAKAFSSKDWDRDFKRMLAKRFVSPPNFTSNFIEIRARNMDIRKKNGWYEAVIRITPRKKIILPFRRGDWQEQWCSKILDEDVEHGSGELVRYPHSYSLNLSVNIPMDFDYKPEAFIGVDIGLNKLAWAVALNKNREHLGDVNFDGREAGHIRDKYNRRRKALQGKGLQEKIVKSKNKETRWMQNENRRISNRLVEFAGQFDNPHVVLEDINMKVLRRRTKNPRIHNWRAGDLRKNIRLKASEEGISSELVNPKNTSQRCKECGHISEDNRRTNEKGRRIKFLCEDCGYENHADFIGAWNITERGMGVW